MHLVLNKNLFDFLPWCLQGCPELWICGILHYESLFYCLQLEAAQIVPPVVVYRQIISSLEKWSENPTASVEPYMAMRHAYPAKQSDTSTKEEINSSDE